MLCEVNYINIRKTACFGEFNTSYEKQAAVCWALTHIHVSIYMCVRERERAYGICVVYIPVQPGVHLPPRGRGGLGEEQRG